MEATGARISLRWGKICLENGVPPNLAHLVEELRKVRDQAIAVLESRNRAFESWLRESCVGVSRTSTNARILYREYSNAFGEKVIDLPEFIRQLEIHDHPHQDGMIAGLMLATDFVGIAQHEETLLRTRQAPAESCPGHPASDVVAGRKPEQSWADGPRCPACEGTWHSVEALAGHLPDCRLFSPERNGGNGWRKRSRAIFKSPTS